MLDVSSKLDVGTHDSFRTGPQSGDSMLNSGTGYRTRNLHLLIQFALCLASCYLLKNKIGLVRQLRVIVLYIAFQQLSL